MRGADMPVRPLWTHICNVVARVAPDSIFVSALISVRKQGICTALVSLLAFSLLFNQVALNLFHDKHKAHESYHGQSQQAQYHNHGEHCKVCSLETLFHPYFEAPAGFHFYQSEETTVAVQVVAKVAASGNFTRGRAPPFPA